MSKSSRLTRATWCFSLAFPFVLMPRCDVILPAAAPFGFKAGGMESPTQKAVREPPGRDYASARWYSAQSASGGMVLTIHLFTIHHSLFTIRLRVQGQGEGAGWRHPWSRSERRASRRPPGSSWPSRPLKTTAITSECLVVRTFPSTTYVGIDSTYHPRCCCPISCGSCKMWRTIT